MVGDYGVPGDDQTTVATGAGGPDDPADAAGSPVAAGPNVPSVPEQPGTDPRTPPFDPYAPPPKGQPPRPAAGRGYPPADPRRSQPPGPDQERPRLSRWDASGWDRPAAKPTGPPPPVDPRGQRALGFALLGLVSAYLIPRIGAWMGVTGVPLLVYDIVGSAVGLVLDLIAIVLGVRYARKAAVEGKRSPGSLGGAVLGALAALTALYVLAQFAFLFPQLRTYYTCLSGANTQVATQACQSSFDKAVKDRTGGAGSPSQLGPTTTLFSVTP